MHFSTHYQISYVKVLTTGQLFNNEINDRITASLDNRETITLTVYSLSLWIIPVEAHLLPDRLNEVYVPRNLRGEDCKGVPSV